MREKINSFVVVALVLSIVAIAVSVGSVLTGYAITGMDTSGQDTSTGTIWYTGGNVGIGTESPKNILEIHGTDSGNSFLSVYGVEHSGVISVVKARFGGPDNNWAQITHNAYWIGNATSGEWQKDDSNRDARAILIYDHGTQAPFSQIRFVYSPKEQGKKNITWQNQMTINQDGTITIANLAGTGERQVCADAFGTLKICA